MCNETFWNPFTVPRTPLPQPGHGSGNTHRSLKHVFFTNQVTYQPLDVAKGRIVYGRGALCKTMNDYLNLYYKYVCRYFYYLTFRYVLVITTSSIFCVILCHYFPKKFVTKNRGSKSPDIWQNNMC